MIWLGSGRVVCRCLQHVSSESFGPSSPLFSFAAVAACVEPPQPLGVWLTVLVKHLRCEILNPSASSFVAPAARVVAIACWAM